MFFMRYIIFIILLLFSAQADVFGQTKEERKELMMLVEERQKLFDLYSETVAKKSGIFGNKTKNDLRTTHEKLKDIIALDNKILNRLKQMLSYRNFEKQTMSYDMSQYEEQSKKLERAQDTLVKQLSRLEKENSRLNKSAAKSSRIYYILIGFVLAWILFALRRKFR